MITETAPNVSGYSFVTDDAGRAQSKRPRQKSDCVVRTFALTFDYPYDVAYDMLAYAGRKSHRGTAKTVWKSYLAMVPGRVRKISFPAVRGERRMNLPKFCVANPRGRFVVQMAGHLTAVVDGVCRDTFAPGSERCIYAAWEIR